MKKFFSQWRGHKIFKKIIEFNSFWITIAIIEVNKDNNIFPLGSSFGNKYFIRKTFIAHWSS